MHEGDSCQQSCSDLPLTTTNAYIWPSPQLDALEEMRFEPFLAGFVNPCDLFLFDGSHSRRSNAADWIRTVRRKLPA